jgi:RND superfamily putative drug exporter
MKVFRLAAGRRTKWVLLAGWTAIAIVLAGSALQFDDIQSNRDVEYLPKSADSAAAIRLEEQAYGDQILTGLLVYKNPDGLSKRDRAAVKAGVASLAERPIKSQLGPAIPIFYKDQKTAAIYFQMRAHGEKELLFAASDRLNEIKRDAPPGVSTKLTGQAGFYYDQARIFDRIDLLLVLGTGLLVALLLLLIYRSPILWMLPLIGVGFAEITSRGLATQLSHAGVTITSQSAALMTVLVFGVGTDYALLLIARYRAELKQTEDRHDAMAFALERTGPTILASAATVIAALLCMVLADANATSGAGPIGAMGIAIAMLSMLTVLPALLLIIGRRAFWPSVPKFGTEEEIDKRGLWSRIADLIARRPVLLTIGVFAVMAVMALGLTQRPGGLDLAGSFHDRVESVEGMQQLERTLPAGATGPMTVFVADPAQVPATIATLKSSKDVALVGMAQRIANVTRIEATLKYGPYSEQAIDALKRVRTELGGAALVSGATAVEADSREYSERDNKLVMPIVLLVVLLILFVLLRSIVAPLVLMFTVVLSFLAVMGASYWAFEHIFGYGGVDKYVPLFVFIFLVALGVDYNIFLMARVREEAAKFDARTAMRRGLIVTGGVITSAGIVLAGTFFVMAAMPITVMTEIGFAIALGVLFDTFVVRTILVPALGFLLGDRMWWPSELGRGDQSPNSAESSPGSATGSPQAKPSQT